MTHQTEALAELVAAIDARHAAVSGNDDSQVQATVADFWRKVEKARAALSSQPPAPTLDKFDEAVAAEKALRSILRIAQQYLPPDGLSAKDAMGEILGIVDPWPLTTQPSGDAGAGAVLTDELIDAVCAPGRAKRWNGDGRQYDRDIVRMALAAFQFPQVREPQGPCALCHTNETGFVCTRACEEHQVREQAALPAFDDERVQVVYQLLCADDAPPDPAEHWEGFVARRIVAALAQGTAPAALPQIEVWFGSMPESNGRENWTVTLRRKERPDEASPSNLHRLMSGVSVYRSEFKGRARYEADRLRFLLGELDKAPHILDYDADLHSGYKEPAAGVGEQATGGDDVMESALCESQSLVLREGQLYRFRRVGDCEKCAAMSAASLEAYGAATKPAQAEPIGYALAMRVLQSDLYATLDDTERAECDAILAEAGIKEKTNG